MPEFDEAQLRSAITDGRIGAISVDTSIFDKYQDNLKALMLLQLRQFAGTSIPFVLSDVIVKEVEAHIAANAREAKEKLWTALKKLKSSWGLPQERDAMVKALGVDVPPEEFAGTSIREYLAETKATIISSDGRVAVGSLIDMYFSAIAPFSHAADKKNEFPDAIALLGLEEWAKANRAMMVVVSNDGDWLSYARASEILICVRDLPAALDLFNSEAGFIASRALVALENKEAKEFEGAINSAIEYFTEVFDPTYDAESYLEYELDYLETTFDEWEIWDRTDYKIVFADEDEIVFSFKIRIDLEFAAVFLLSARDSVDRDYVSMGTSKGTARDSLVLEVVVSMDRNIDPEPSIYSVQITPPRYNIRFGNIDPDWQE